MKVGQYNKLRVLRLLQSMAVMGACGVCTIASAAPLDLSKVPLFLNQAVDPNVMVTFDDSGSMSWGFTPNEVQDGDFPPSARPSYAIPIPYYCYWQTPMGYSSAFNKQYYDPNVTYSPPLRADGTSFPNARFTAAWEDGMAANRPNSPTGQTSVRNLSNDYRVTWGWDVTRNPDFIEHSNSPSTCNNGSRNGDVSGTRRWTFPFGDSAFFYRFTGDPANLDDVFDPTKYTAVNVSTQSAAIQTNFANWWSYYRIRNFSASTALSRAFGSIDRNIRVAWQTINRNGNISNNTNQIRPIDGSWRQSFYEWIYQISRSNGGTPNRRAMRNAGEYFKRAGGNSFTNPYYEPSLLAATYNGVKELSCRQNFHMFFTDGAWKDAAGISTNPDAGTATFPDGKSYADSPYTKVFHNEDPSNVAGLADNAFEYWSNDLRPDLPDRVPTFVSDPSTGVTGPVIPGASMPDNVFDVPEIYWNPANNPASWQHMVNFMVVLDVATKLPFPDALGDLRRGNVAWPFWDTYSGETAEKIDDTWHATLNSRGEMLVARRPDELIRALEDVLQNIARRRASASAVSVSSGVVTTGSLAYQTGFDTGDWSGFVEAREVNPDGSLGPVRWEAGPLLDAKVAGSGWDRQRKVFTVNTATGLGVPFRLASLSPTQLAALNRNPDTGVADLRASQRIDFIRGDRSQEISNGGDFRSRSTVLGAVISSQAVFIEAPFDRYDDAAFRPGDPEYACRSNQALCYNTFQVCLSDLAGDVALAGLSCGSLRQRSPVVYVGGNDGMLHAFDADTGEELWAYIPGAVYPNLGELTDPNFQFNPFVDQQIIPRDVFVRGQWRTVAAVTLRGGGQSVSLLDVTDPGASASEATLATKVMWEFTDRSSPGDADLGYTFGLPQIGRLNNGRYAVFVPAGYNSDEADGAVGSGRSVLFVLAVEDGTVLKKFDLGASSQGMAGVNLGDYDADLIYDVAFGGDLSGKMYRFDLESNAVGSWCSDLIFQTPANQAITVTPRILKDTRGTSGGADPWDRPGRFIVAFGTGRYLTQLDKVSNDQQSYYGLRESGRGLSCGSAAASYPIPANSLIRQTLTQDAQGFRKITDNPVTPGKRGWTFDFILPGERNVSIAGLLTDLQVLIASTIIPASADPCDPSLSSAILVLDIINGGFLDNTPLFDTNGNGVVDQGDYSGGSGSSTVGKIVDTAVLQPPPVVTPPGGGAGVLLIGGANGANGRPDAIPFPEFRRRSWREVGENE
ncbi:MAG: PQQ-binding-like beta-propeller repeat protein [Xanthomonadales bacterium]|nr:PQQ-binding-like beta-propeller repeat protein [Xanthomonadales bacterium]